jgi:hypothetical protein
MGGDGGGSPATAGSAGGFASAGAATAAGPIAAARTEAAVAECVREADGFGGDPHPTASEPANRIEIRTLCSIDSATPRAELIRSHYA